MITIYLSSPRKRGSSYLRNILAADVAHWMPAFAGMTRNYFFPHVSFRNPARPEPTL